MKKEVSFMRTNEWVGCNVDLYLEKTVCIEDMTVDLELEIKRGGIGSIRKNFRLSEVTPSKLSNLNNYGLNLDMAGWDGKNLAQAMIDTANSLEERFVHKKVGWFKLNGQLVFRMKRLYGSQINSNLSEDKFILREKGSLNDWVEGLNKYAVGNKYIELLIVAGFSSIFIKLFNMDNDIGSLVFNCCGGIEIERDIIMQIINSIWAEPSNRNGELIKIFSGNEKKLIDSIEGNEGLSILVKDIGPRYSLINLVNSIQVNNINSTTIISSGSSILSDDKNKINILSKENIVEIDFDIHNIGDFRANLNKIDKLTKANYGLAGQMFIEYLFKEGIEGIKDKLQLLEIELFKELENTRLDFDKVPKIAILIMVARYVVEALGLNINLKQLKDTLIELGDENRREIPQYNKALGDIIDYFYRNRNKYILRGDDIKSNTEGLYELDRHGEVSKIIIPNATFNGIIKKLGYDKIKTLRAWKSNGMLECEIGRNNKKIRFGIDDPRCVVILVRGGKRNEH